LTYEEARMKKTRSLLVLSFTVVFLMGWIGFSEALMCDKCRGAGGPEMGHEMGMRGEHPGGRHPMMEMLMSLGLDDAQKDVIKTLHLKCKKEAIRKNADLKIAEIELREILGKETVDMTAAEAKIKEIEGIKANLRILHVKNREEIKSKLTPEQKKKLSSLMEMRQMGGAGTMGMGDKQGKCRMMKGRGPMGGDDREGDDSQPPSGAERPHHH
jgi:Spy/CpxP family protein refolding chaperone